MCVESNDTKKIITLFESLVAKRKSLPNADMLSADLKDIYQTMMPYLNVSKSTKIYIKNKIDDSLKSRWK